jgi:hypothetical protein
MANEVGSKTIEVKDVESQKRVRDVLAIVAGYIVADSTDAKVIQLAVDTAIDIFKEAAKRVKIKTADAQAAATNGGAQ